LRLAVLLWLLAAGCWACPDDGTLGLANNNPGNLIAQNPRQHWKGQLGHDAWHQLRFQSPELGLRAIRVVLKTYKRRYHIHTLERLCGRWVYDNADQAAKRNWLKCVRQRMKAKPGQVFDFTDPMTTCRVAKAIVYAENSCDPYPDEMYLLVFLTR
jgi:hypothetical protein